MEILLLFLLVAFTGFTGSAPLARTDITAIPYGSAIYEAASLKEVLLVARKIAAGKTITLKLRYKEPYGTESKLITIPITYENQPFEKASTDFRFAAAVASFGMLLRDSDYRADSNIPLVLETASAALGEDSDGYRKEFLELVKKYGGKNVPE